MKFLTENLTRNCKNFCEKGHWCVDDPLNAQSNN